MRVIENEWGKMVPFFKYQGAGNDFIMIDDREAPTFDRQASNMIENWCQRRFGVGADGLILLRECLDHDFEMIYFNADGREGSMCGNGGRCAAAFAHHLGMVNNRCRFLAVDGPHEALLHSAGEWVELSMRPVGGMKQMDEAFVLDTGSPHYVVFVDELAAVDVVARGRALRYSEPFRELGINVNFVQALDDGIAVATYERGVEDETLACGTGITAAALAYHRRRKGLASSPLPVVAKGGRLEVRFRAIGDGFADIWLCGPAARVFQGEISLPV
jgi:diaminopimelate epimerase